MVSIARLAVNPRAITETFFPIYFFILYYVHDQLLISQEITTKNGESLGLIVFPGKDSR